MDEKIQKHRQKQAARVLGSYNPPTLPKGDSLEKSGHSQFPIGTIHNGYKKVAEGKWNKVSEHGLTKEEHGEKYRSASKSLLLSRKPKLWQAPFTKEEEKWQEENNFHNTIYWNGGLDNKDYTDREVLESGLLTKAQNTYSHNKGIINSTLQQEGRHTPNTLNLQKENAKLKEQFGDSLFKSQSIEKSKRELAFEKQYGTTAN